MPPLCIHGAGAATVGQYERCIWTTPNGSTAVLVITNPSVANLLTVIISGAPPEIRATDGTAIEGPHTIPPNTPTANIIAYGDFKGQQVMIFNAADPPADGLVVTATLSAT